VTRPWKIVVLAVAIAGLVAGGWFIYSRVAGGTGGGEGGSGESTPTSSAPVSIPQEVLDNKFGFLSGGPEDASFIGNVGAAWVRPHPGAFVWERIQTGEDASFDFSLPDKWVQRYQEKEIATLATIWPFASWDQVRRPGQDKCMVSENDEFSPTGAGAKKGAKDLKEGEDEEMYARGYLPLFRCNPYDWEAYAAWVTASVERYDGDGSNDMPGLEIPIKYWEVMNEPDLDGNETLDFYKEDATAYAELLIKTAAAIRQADSEAKVVIAGAAGGDDRFLGFYRDVFQSAEAIAAFDIGNVHCISNDDYQSFNVDPYKKMLAEFGIDKPVWVTEAQAILSTDPDINATIALNATKEALALGAGRIFFTQYGFEPWEGWHGAPGGTPSVEKELEGDDPEAAYRVITCQ